MHAYRSSLSRVLKILVSLVNNKQLCSSERYSYPDKRKSVFQGNVSRRNLNIVKGVNTGVKPGIYVYYEKFPDRETKKEQSE